MRSVLSLVLAALLCHAASIGGIARASAGVQQSQPLGPNTGSPLNLDPGDTVLIVGNTFAERLDESGYFHALMHATFPDHNLRIRSVAWSGDTVSLRPREMNVPTMLEHVDAYDPDVIVMFFGMVESFEGAAGLAKFEADLQGLIERVGKKSDGAARELVLVTPIRHEALDGSSGADGVFVDDHNESIDRYAGVMRSAADQTEGVSAVDLFTPDFESSGPLTTNGIHPSDEGAFVFTREIGRELGWVSPWYADKEPAETSGALVAAAADAHWHQRLIYRPTNTEYVWGRRHEPFGIVNFPAEFEQLERMLAAREARMWAMDTPTPDALMSVWPGADAGQAVWPTLPLDLDLPEDAWTPPAIEAKGTETSLGSTTILPPEEFKSSFTLADGYVAEIFASEQDFPELANPLALAFDERHRLWVLCAITYPHLLPGDRPRCKLLILEDTDADGRADRRTVFADELYIPTGFGVDSTVDNTTEVYIGQAPDLLKLTDTDGDSVADVREIVATGFAMPDSHHQVSAFEWDPMGGLWFHEGVFSIANVETPWRVRRTRDAAAWRLDPVTGRLDVMSHAGFANPWGLAFDNFGAGILADASGGSNYALSHVVHAFEYPRKPGRPGHIINRGRPTAGAEILYSRHFPDDVQGSFLVNQSIGFHGTRWNSLAPAGSSWSSQPMPKDLIESSDTNFRPVAIETGPDGAIYLVDWCNPLIGHMQYSTRDPRRDSTHGRIWRIRHESRPLLDPPDIVGASPTELCDLLRLPEDNTRQLVRRRLQKLPYEVFESEVVPWFEELDRELDPLYWRLKVERLWLGHARQEVNTELVAEIMLSGPAEAKGAAVRSVRMWLQHNDLSPMNAMPYVMQAMGSEDMRVRLEGVVAVGFMSPYQTASNLAGMAASSEMDDALRTVLTQTLVHLSRNEAEVHPIVRRLRLERMSPEDLLAEERDEVVLDVLLGREDIPAETRLAAAGEGLGDQASVARALFEKIGSAKTSHAGKDALARLLMQLPREAVLGAQDAWDNAFSPSGMRTMANASALAVLLHHGIELTRPARDRTVNGVFIPAEEGQREPIERLSLDVLVPAAELLDPETAPDGVFPLLFAELGERVYPSERGGFSGSYEAILPQAFEQAALHARDEHLPELFEWLSQFLPASALPLADWGKDHTLAMLAKRAMDAIERERWPEGYDEYEIPSADPEVLALGERIYFDEAVGCVRCHAEDGRGLEGFPALEGSARLLGNPQRTASMVVHGAYGELTASDGRTFMSAMEPLGENLTDEEIAAVLTYARRSWTNFADPVEPETVASARGATPPGGSYWPIEELDARFPLASDSLSGPLQTVANTTPASTSADPMAGETPQRRSMTWTPLLLFGLSIGLLVLLSVGFGAIVLATNKGSSSAKGSQLGNRAHKVAVLNVVALSRSVLSERTPHLNALIERGATTTLVPDLPAVTCTGQSSMLTGLPVREHGVVANGWYDREHHEPRFWKQSNRLVHGAKVWETARDRDPECTCANLFWWFNMYSSADVSVTPRPQYRADGTKVPDCYSHPARWRDELQAALGPFPLFRFWGPMAGIESSRWIADAARMTDERFDPTLSLVYLPHLDYALQKHGPGSPEAKQAAADLDAVVGGLVDYFEVRDASVLVVSEYGIEPVKEGGGAVHPNRVLREAGLIAVREENGRELLDCGASRAFALADHQVAHVYCSDDESRECARAALESAPDVERVLGRDEQRELGLDHERAGELLVVCEPGCWCTYYSWTDDARAPDVARTVDIHRKPGYDPCELFIDPAISLPKLRLAGKLAKKKLGFRTLMDVIPLDASLVKGTHGRVEVEEPYAPILIEPEDGVLSERHNAMPMRGVHDVILEHMFPEG